MAINTMQRGGKVDRLKEAAHRAVKNYIGAKPHQAITQDMAIAAQALILAGWRPSNPKQAQLEKDKERLDWLASTEQSTGQVLLPTDCVVKNVGSLRGAIDAAMRDSRLDAMAEKP